MEKAVRNLKKKGVEPTKEAMAKEFDAVLALAERLTRRAPKGQRLNEFLLDELKAELVELEKQIDFKKAEIKQKELKMGINTTLLVATYVEKYAASKEQTSPANNRGAFNKAIKRICKRLPSLQHKIYKNLQRRQQALKKALFQV